MRNLQRVEERRGTQYMEDPRSVSTGAVERRRSLVKFSALCETQLLWPSKEGQAIRDTLLKVS